jgi:5-methylcytosine-specific restriction protein A
VPFADNRTGGQRTFRLERARLRSTDVVVDGSPARFSTSGDAATVETPSGRYAIGAAHPENGDLVVTLGAACARGLSEVPAAEADVVVAAATILAAVTGDPVSGALPPSYVASHHLAVVVGQDPDDFSARHGTHIGPARAELRGLVGLVQIVTPAAGGSAGRRTRWLRDEGMLALDLYFREGPRVPIAAVRQLSRLLRALPIESYLAADATFRSLSSVGTKLANFRALDPTIAGGLEHGSAQDSELWAEFHDDRPRLHHLAAAIRAAIASPTDVDVAGSDDPDFADAEEGAIFTRVHRARERNRAIVARKKRAVLQASGALLCEACGFDFHATYGELGREFVECHHTRPVSELMPGDRTRLEDLALVCANCHRMLHRRRPWLNLEQLRAVIETGVD